MKISIPNLSYLSEIHIYRYSKELDFCIHLGNRNNVMYRINFSDVYYRVYINLYSYTDAIVRIEKSYYIDKPTDTTGLLKLQKALMISVDKITIKEILPSEIYIEYLKIKVFLAQHLFDKAESTN